MRPCRCASRCSPPNASRGPRPAAWPTSSTPWRARSGELDTARHRDAGRRLPAALPRRPRAGHGRADRSSCEVPGSAVAVRAQHGHRPRRGGRRLSAAPGRPSGRLRSRRLLRRCRRRLRRQRLALRAVLPGGARGAAGRRAAARRPPPPRLAHRAGGHLPRRALRGRPDRRPGGDPDDPPQPRLPRLDAAQRACRSSACAPGDGVVPADADGIDLLPPGSSGPSSSTRSRPASRPRR